MTPVSYKQSQLIKGSGESCGMMFDIKINYNYFNNLFKYLFVDNYPEVNKYKRAILTRDYGC